SRTGHLPVSGGRLRENRTHQEGTAGTDGRRRRTAFRHQDARDKGSMLAGHAILDACPGQLPWNLADPGSRQVWMRYSDWAVDESDRYVRVAMGQLHQSGQMDQLEGRHRGVPGRRTGIAAHGMAGGMECQKERLEFRGAGKAPGDHCLHRPVGSSRMSNSTLACCTNCSLLAKLRSGAPDAGTT